MAQIFLTTPGGGTWTVPADCTSASIECIGGGASGGSIWWGGAESKGGGGGAYSKKNTISLTPNDSISYSVGLGGVHPSGGSAHWVSGLDTWFKSTGDVLAKGATNGTGGQASSCVGDTKYNGGNGGNSSGTVGAGGGGAAGLNGAGNNGTDGTSGGGPGGSGDAGYGGTGGSAGNPGGAGTEWDATHGSGGGGGGASFNGNGGKGGAYGAGGGGNYRLDLGAVPGAGENGIIVITYTPAGSSKFFQMF